MNSTKTRAFPVWSNGEPAQLARFSSLVRQAQQANLIRLAAIATQLGLLVVLAHGFHIESNAFRNVMVLALVGFMIHHLLPMSYRLPFFVLLSFCALVLVVMPMNAVRLVAVGLMLIGLCHLPIAFKWRLALVTFTAVALTLARAEWFVLPGYEPLWPILGAMFMFRLMIYLADLRTQSARFNTWQSLAYFFMLPNVCFPMYPLVDYQTFYRTYFNEPTPWRMYQVGIKWIFRGMVQLLLFRAILQNVIISADNVDNASDLLRYMITTFLLYLQISGQFHIIIGILHMFGFNLPETHHNFLLSSSFTDFWRRINIYWKDYIQKLFFNPIYFRTKYLGSTTAMVVATLAAFVFTWLLHSYQWFWIRGSFPMIWQDVLFWGILAILVLANVLYEQRYGRSRPIKGKRTLISRLGLGLRTIATFCTIITLWCLWTFQGSFGEWVEFMGNISRFDQYTGFLLILGLASLGLAGALFGDVEREYSAGRITTSPNRKCEPALTFWSQAAVATILILAVPAVVKFRHYLPMSDAATLVLGDVRQDQSTFARNERDQGYYENLTNTKTYNLALWELYNRRAKGSELNIGQTDAVAHLPGKFHQFEIAPSKQVQFMGTMVSTNQWGMRDRPYEKKKPAGRFRVALLGSSITMGWGVGDDETYENLLENRLNDDADQIYNRVELLNFAVAGYSDLQKLAIINKVIEFEPDAILWEAHATGQTWIVNYLARIIRSKVPIPYPELRDWLDTEGVTAELSGIAIRSKLRQMAPALQLWVWRQMRNECDSRGIAFHLLILPRADQMRQDEISLAEVARAAHEVNIPAFDLSEAFTATVDRATLAVAPGDAHPNAHGHQIVAEALYRQMMPKPLSKLSKLSWSPARKSHASLTE